MPQKSHTKALERNKQASKGKQASTQQITQSGPLPSPRRSQCDRDAVHLLPTAHGKHSPAEKGGKARKEVGQGERKRKKKENLTDEHSGASNNENRKQSFSIPEGEWRE